MKVKRLDVFSAISIAVDENKIKEANKLLKIVSNSISKDKINRTFSSDIEISKKDFYIIKNIMPDISYIDDEPVPKTEKKNN